MNYIDVIIRLILAIFIGGLIGYEREFKNRPAGFRTHILVCVGAAVISMIQLSAVQETVALIMKNPALQTVLRADIGRLGAQVIVGVGFLGAGTILHEKGSVKGLTTAASVWVVACIGLGIGLGYYFLSISSAVIVFLVLVTLKKFESRFIDRYNLAKIEIYYCDKQLLLTKLEQYFDINDIKIKAVEYSSMEEDNTGCSVGIYSVNIPKSIEISLVVGELSLYKEIKKIRVI